MKTLSPVGARLDYTVNRAVGEVAAAARRNYFQGRNQDEQ